MTPTVDARLPIVLRPEKKGTFLARHPWVLDRSIMPPAEGIEPNSEVDLVLPDGRWIAAGIYNPDSRIRVRLYTWDRGERLDDLFWRRRLQRALDLRKDLGLLNATSAARLVFSEADGMSGLIVDKYADHLVIQLNARAIERPLPVILASLVEALNPASVQLRVDPKIKQAEGIRLDNQWLHGPVPSSPIVIEQAGIRSQVDLEESQKTGFYLDQRDNRVAAAKLAPGRTVLDVCCYTGGFALTCARAGAAHVWGLDSSRPAIESARAQAIENGISNAEFEVADCFTHLEQLNTAQRRFGLIILDPPRFAGSRQSIDRALRAYHRLNRLAIQSLEPGGYLVTCSCSGLVSRADFIRMLGGVSQKTGREIQILQQRGAAPDHPVMISCPETDYLKCLICRVA